MALQTKYFRNTLLEKYSFLLVTSGEALTLTFKKFSMIVSIGMASASAASAQDLAACIAIANSVYSPTVAQINFTNNCGECVKFRPLAVGQGGAPDILMSNFQTLGQSVSSVSLNAGESQTFFYGAVSGTYRATASNPSSC